MKPILVTGATGFLGWHVARLLTERGNRFALWSVIQAGEGIGRGGSYRGSARSRSLARALEGCGVVFHVAADYRFGRKIRVSCIAPTWMARVTCWMRPGAGVERVVYTSTVGCIGMPPEWRGDEQTAVGEQDMHGGYKRSKFLAEQVALEFAGMVSRGDRESHSSGRRPRLEADADGENLLDFLRRKMPAYVDTGLNLVDVRDIAVGHLLAGSGDARENATSWGARTLRWSRSSRN